MTLYRDLDSGVVSDSSHGLGRYEVIPEEVSRRIIFTWASGTSCVVSDEALSLSDLVGLVRQYGQPTSVRVEDVDEEGEAVEAVLLAYPPQGSPHPIPDCNWCQGAGPA